MKTAITLAAMLVPIAVVAYAQGPYQVGDTTRTEASGDPKQVVCLSQGEIGTRLARRRICRTREEWDQIRAEERRTVEKTQLFKPTVCPPNLGDC
jgi:hypothetical protein